MKKGLILNKCEIETCTVTECLHLHHIIGRKEIGTNNHKTNLSILCPTHHSMVHAGKIKIIGIYPSTKLPNKRSLVYEIDGKKNIDINESYFQFKPIGSKLFK